MTNRSHHLVDCSELHFIKVQFHMVPLVITKFIRKHQLAPSWGSNISLFKNNKILSMGCSTMFFAFSLASLQFLGKRSKPIHSDHFWWQSLWTLVNLFLKMSMVFNSTMSPITNFFFGHSISDALAMVAGIPYSWSHDYLWLHCQF